MRKFSALTLLLALMACQSPVDTGVMEIQPALATEPVSEDADDPAIWVNPSDPAQSLIIGTNKVMAPSGSVVVFGLDGKTRQTLDGIDRPNNVDIEYGLKLGDESMDIAVATERLKSRLRIFRIKPDGSGLTDLSNVPVFDGQEGELAAPMGIAMYRRSSDGTVFAIVGRKNGPLDAYLWQYRLEEDGNGSVRGVKVREFGAYSGSGEIEAIAVDDALGYVYYADEGNGIHKWHADPDHPEAAKELAHFGQEGFQADREGIGIYALPDGTGYILCTDQIEGSSQYRIFRREGAAENPHDHSEVVKVVSGGADSTDGIEVSSANLGPQFPGGLLVAMNSSGKNFLLYRWEDIANTGEPKLKINSAAEVSWLRDGLD